MNVQQTNTLSWQTGVLTFRNTSWQAVRQNLENQYETEVLMYQELLRQGWLQMTDEVVDEIRLVLYIQYDPSINNLVVRGFPFVES
ncbi:MAG: hypothetical protein AAF206_07380 [Bacteroidota bacterium]